MIVFFTVGDPWRACGGAIYYLRLSLRIIYEESLSVSRHPGPASLFDTPALIPIVRPVLGRGVAQPG